MQHGDDLYAGSREPREPIFGRKALIEALVTLALLGLAVAVGGVVG